MYHSASPREWSFHVSTIRSPCPVRSNMLRRARLLTWKEFIEQEQRALCEFEKERLTLDTNLIIENLEITLDETNERYQIEINTRDKELEELRGIIKKNRKINMPAVIISSVVGGIAVGIGGTYAIDQLLDK